MKKDTAYFLNPFIDLSLALLSETIFFLWSGEGPNLV